MPTVVGQIRRTRFTVEGFNDTFVLGVTDPVLNPGLMGAGLIRPVRYDLPALTPTSGTTYTIPNGVVIRDRVIDAYVDTIGTGRADNCVIRGVADGIPRFNGNPDQRAMVRTNGANEVSPLDMYATIGQDYDTRGFNATWCTIQPQTPSPYQNGVGNKNARTYRCLIQYVTDGFSSFAQSSDPNPDGRCRNYDEGSLLRRPVQWRPDTANGNRSHSHNDGEQDQGNTGPDRFDIYRVGTGFEWNISTEYGTQPPSDPREHHSCIGINDNTQPTVYATYQQVFFWGGIAQMNGGGDPPASGGHIVLDRCRHERPGSSPTAPLWAAAIHSGYSITGSGGNRYHDSPNSGEVPISRPT